MGKLLIADIYNALPGAVPWVLAPYPGDVIDYKNATTVAKREVECEINNLANIDFYIKCNADKLLVRTLFEAIREIEDNCSLLKNPLIRFPNVTLTNVFNHLNTTFGEKIGKMCTAEHAKIQEVFNMLGTSIQPLHTKQEKSC